MTNETANTPNKSISMFTDDQLREWVGNAVWYVNPSNDRWYLAEELLVLRGKVIQLQNALKNIDALDPEWQGIESCHPDTVKGLVLQMGEISRQAMKETSDDLF